MFISDPKLLFYRFSKVSASDQYPEDQYPHVDLAVILLLVTKLLTSQFKTAGKHLQKYNSEHSLINMCQAVPTASGAVQIRIL